MSILNKLASSLSRRDEIPNQELAKEIIASNDSAAVDELVAFIASGSKAIRADAIKTLYEVGEVKPELIAPHIKAFLALLDSKDNRLQWGAMMALSAIAELEHKRVFTALAKIVDVARKGSVITRDHAVLIMSKLARMKPYADKVFPLLLDEVGRAPLNQLPMYAERAMDAARDIDKASLIRTINARLPEVERESARRRLEKVVRKLSS
jgi:hypothetical protein